MSKNLVIVESPAKAKTIAKYLGKDFEVTSSFGHIRDLPKKDMSIDIENDFMPTYVISPDKKKRVTELKRQAKDAEIVWLATDEDREGEAIAWHLAEALKLEPNRTKRITFHEITKDAITDAVKHPREIDKNIVDAQQARRVLDRLVGYELSPVLWRKVQAGLSAGRVQSVAVRLIVEREQEIENFAAESAFKVTAKFDLGVETILEAELPKQFKTEDEAKKWLEKVAGAEFRVNSLETSPSKRSPGAPFTTSTLQQEASRKLGFSVKQTMVLAQRLYESGHITYMRTDSVQLSATAINQAKSIITSEFGAQYHQVRAFKSKAGAQEAHEAIRPTDLSKQTAGNDLGQSKLYDLVRQRTLASQMADAKLQRTTATISISTVPEELKAKGEIVEFEGFLKVYPTTKKEGKLLPPLEEGQPLPLKEILATQTFKRPPARYTEASLVRTLEEMGIGRPSTYAPTISTVQDRGYVEKADKDGEIRAIKIISLNPSGQIAEAEEDQTYGQERGKLFPTQIGILVTEFLTKHFADIVDYDFTARAEEEFDKIAKGLEKWNAMIADFYAKFHKTVELAADISRAEAAGARELGADPKTGKPIIARMGRYGPMVQRGSSEDEEKPEFAPIPKNVKLHEITLDDALELLKLPRKIGETAEGEDILANFGRFGPYIKVGSMFVSIKPDDPFTITEERAKELIAEKQEADAKKNIAVFGNIKVLNGRFGPYITDGRKNAKIPKDVDPEKLTEKEAEELLAKAPTRKRRPKR